MNLFAFENWYETSLEHRGQIWKVNEATVDWNYSELSCTDWQKRKHFIKIQEDKKNPLYLKIQSQHTVFGNIVSNDESLQGNKI